MKIPIYVVSFLLLFVSFILNIVFVVLWIRDMILILLLVVYAVLVLLADQNSDYVLFLSVDNF
jgi:hypothetical protein